jgi:undecaprenyl-diphosphatase
MPLYLFFLFFVIRKYRWKTLVIILFAAFMILCSDQLSDLVKEFVHRSRPSRQPGLMVHIVEAYKGGAYGFYSSHASNTFSIVIFLIIILDRKYKFVYVLAILWSLIMSYTRIYLGVHYPGDIITGWLAGSLLGFLFGKGSVLVCKLITQSCIKDPVSPDSEFDKSSKSSAKTDSH